MKWIYVKQFGRVWGRYVLVEGMPVHALVSYFFNLLSFAMHQLLDRSGQSASGKKCFAPRSDTGEIRDALFTEWWELGKFSKNSKQFALILSTNLQFAENRHNLHRHSQILNMWPRWVPTSEARVREREISLHANGQHVCMCWCKRCRLSDSSWSFSLQAFEEASKILTVASPVAAR